MIDRLPQSWLRAVASLSLDSGFRGKTMTVLRVAILLSLAILAGCVSSEEQDAMDLGRDRDRCADYGYRPGIARLQRLPL